RCRARGRERCVCRSGGVADVRARPVPFPARRVGSRGERAARGARDAPARGCGRFDPDCGRALRVAVCGAVELQVRGRNAAPGALRLGIRRAAVDTHGSRRSIPPQLEKAEPMSNLHAFDWFFIALYFLILFGIGWWAARREKAVSSDYFLASRDVAWFAVG